MGLSVHTSHILQPPDVLVFGQLKEEFCRLLNIRAMKTNKEERHYIFTVCELLWNTSHSCVNPQNAIAGLRRTGIWSDELKGVDIRKSFPTDITYGIVLSE